jgi:hypothetical protein
VLLLLLLLLNRFSVPAEGGALTKHDCIMKSNERKVALLRQNASIRMHWLLGNTVIDTAGCQ